MDIVPAEVVVAPADVDAVLVLDGVVADVDRDAADGDVDIVPVEVIDVPADVDAVLVLDNVVVDGD